jgi:hypothetical protein
MTRVFFLLMFSGIWISSNAQVSTDAASVFRMQLFVDNKNVTFSGMDPMVVKSDSLYEAFRNAVDLKLDTLKVAGSRELARSVFSSQYQFYRLLAYDKKSIIYKKKLNSSEGQFFMISGNCILAINQRTGLSYRLQGFNGNDFLNFLSDFKEGYKESTGDVLSTKDFLKNYQVEGLDFECLYQGLKQDKIDREKYPCLKRNSEPVWIR